MKTVAPPRRLTLLFAMLFAGLAASLALGCDADPEGTVDAAIADGGAGGADDAAIGSDGGPIADAAMAMDGALPRDAATDAGGSEFTHRAIVNLRPAYTDFSALTPWIEGISHVRVWGGSRGMATFPTMDVVPEFLLDHPTRYNVVTDEEIDALLALQAAHGVRTIYLVNINDTLESQMAFVERLLDAGLDLAFLELGNEIYLRKFRDGDLTGLGVTRAWSPEQYVDEVLDVWAPAMGTHGLPLYIVGASHGTEPTGGNMMRQYWNQVLVDALETRPGRIDGVTFHRYAGEERTGSTHEEDISNESFEFLGTFGTLPVAITESGYFFTEMTPANLELAAEFWSAFRAALKPADLFGVHVMQRRTGAVGDLSYGLYDVDGISQVGTRFDQWLRTGE